MGETRRSHGTWYFEFLSTRRESAKRASSVNRQKSRRWRVPLCILSSEWENSCSYSKLIRTSTKYIYINDKHKKIVGDRTSTFCVLSYRHDNFYCAGIVILTVRIIFFGVLRECYKITVPHSNFYLEFSYSFWQTFFSVYRISFWQALYWQ